MHLTVSCPPVMATYAQHQEPSASPAPAVTASTISRVLSCRVCIDWKDSLLVSIVVSQVISAVFIFFNYSIIIATMNLVTAAFLAMIRKDYKDYANLRKETATLSKENARLANTSFALRRREEAYGKLNTKYEGLTEAHAIENKKLTANREKYEALFATLAQTLNQSVGDIQKTLAVGHQVTHQQILEAQAAFGKLQGAIGSIDGVSDEMKASNQHLVTNLGEFSQLLQVLHTAGDVQMRMSQAMNAQLTGFEKQNAVLKERGDVLKTYCDRLMTIIQPLEQAVSNITASAGINHQSALEIREAISSIRQQNYALKPLQMKVHNTAVTA